MKRRKFIQSLTLGSGIVASSGLPALSCGAPEGARQEYKADIIIYGAQRQPLPQQYRRRGWENRSLWYRQTSISAE